MRDYSKFASTFWTGETGRLLRKEGRDAQVTAIYLFTGSMANMIGLYHMPLALLADHTGIPLKGASKALRRVCDTGFCLWDEGLEHVFVKEMASQQLGEPLKPGDNRVPGVISMWQSYAKSPFYTHFHARYAASFHLPEPKPLGRGFQAPPKPGTGAGAGAGLEEGASPSTPRKSKPLFVPPSLEEVRQHCLERKSSIDPERFVAHYTANGWVQSSGRPIQDWKAAVVTWEKNERKHGGPKQSRPSASTIAEQAEQALRERQGGI